MAVIDDRFVDSAVTTPQTHATTNKQNAISPIVEVSVVPSIVTTNYAFVVQVSFDNTNWRTVYASPTITNASWRRVVFSNSGAASDTDAVAANATINKSAILEPFVQVVITPSGALTVQTDFLFSDYSKG